MEMEDRCMEASGLQQGWERIGDRSTSLGDKRNLDWWPSDVRRIRGRSKTRPRHTTRDDAPPRVLLKHDRGTDMQRIVELF